MPDTSALAQLRHQPERQAVGALDHYVKSNLDGSYPARVAVYRAGPSEVEVLKLEAHGADAAYVTARLDWRVFSATRAESWVLTPDSRRRPMAGMELDVDTHQMRAAWNQRHDTLVIPRYPIHIFNFDLISLNMILPHWLEPEGALTFGVVQPDFAPNPPALVRYEGTATLRYLGRETRYGQACRAYTLGGEGLGGQTGRAWVNLAEGYFQDVELPVPDNPDWNSFKFQWAGREHRDPAGWQAYIAEAVQRLRA
ncbi:MAG: hypothetical protein IT317_05000 [Anaerolineales bacterium]|nr:hypothetical protein [Anaerolineales bacterium]